MKTTLLVLLGTALLAIPGAAATETAGSACLVIGSGAAEGALYGALLPWEEPVDAAVGAPAPLCPQLQPCVGGLDCGGAFCTSVSIGSRCCLQPGTLTQQCCPVGQTVQRITCSCIGASCTTASMQTAGCA